MLSTATITSEHRPRTLPHSRSNHLHKPRTKPPANPPLPSLTCPVGSARPQTATASNRSVAPTAHPHSPSAHFPPQDCSPSQSLRRTSSTPILQRVSSGNYKRKDRAGTISPLENRSASSPQAAAAPPFQNLSPNQPPANTYSFPQSLPFSSTIKKPRRKDEMMVWPANEASPDCSPTSAACFGHGSLRAHESSPEMGPRTPIASARVQADETEIGDELPSPAARRSKPDERRKRVQIDFTTFPQNELISRLAALLQQIATANDQIDEPVSAMGATAMSEWAASLGSRRQSLSNTSALSSPSGTWSRRTLRAGERPQQSPTVAHFQKYHHPLGEGGSSAEDQALDPSFDFGQIRAASGVHPDLLTTAAKKALASPSALLTFHAKHVPQISIEAYLRRIQKYCPMTNEVFVGVLVYLDRMSGIRGPRGEQFVIDSWNVHRFLIATVTATSKFFSDVFYTNSRYAKVGGLPLKELDQLELQFLLLNDFRLTISVDELDGYGARLLGQEEENGGASVRPVSCCSWSEESSEATVTPGSPGSVTASSSFVGS